MSFEEAFVATFTFCLSTLIGLAVVVPFVGIVVRYRANYNPRALNLGGESDEARVAPRISSLFAMFLRVRRIEGWRGLWKGYMPSLLYTIFHTFLALIYLGASVRRPKGQYSIPEASALRALIYGIVVSFLSLPFVIITNRSIITPYKLGAFSPRRSLQLLLTGYERSRPWMLYLTPGLMLSQFLHILFIAVISRLVRAILVPGLNNGLEAAEDSGSAAEISTVALSIFILFQALAGTGVLCPLEVMSTRLSIQKNYTTGMQAEEEAAEAEAALASGGATVAGEQIEFAGENEDVLNLRSQSGEQPYNSLRDCFNCILEEEGVASLFRAWWLTMLGAVLSGLA